MIRIITCNIPLKVLEEIDEFCGPDKLYPSRSEFVREALRNFLESELNPSSESLSLSSPFFQEETLEKPQPKIISKDLHVKCTEISTSHPGRHLIDVSNIHSLIQEGRL